MLYIFYYIVVIRVYKSNYMYPLRPTSTYVPSIPSYPPPSVSIFFLFYSQVPYYNFPIPNFPVCLGSRNPLPPEPPPFTSNMLPVV